MSPCVLEVWSLVGGVAKFWSVAAGGGQVKRFRGDGADPASASEVHVFSDCSIAPPLILTRWLRVVADLLLGFGGRGLTLILCS